MGAAGEKQYKQALLEGLGPFPYAPPLKPTSHHCVRYVAKPQWMTSPQGDGLPQPAAKHLAVHIYSACFPQSKSQLCCGRVSRIYLITSSVGFTDSSLNHSIFHSCCTQDDLMVQVEVKGMPSDRYSV